MVARHVEEGGKYPIREKKGDEMKSNHHRKKRIKRKKQSYEYSAKYMMTMLTRWQKPILKGPIPKRLTKIIHDLFEELKITPGSFSIKKKYITIKFTTHNPDISFDTITVEIKKRTSETLLEEYPRIIRTKKNIRTIWDSYSHQTWAD